MVKKNKAMIIIIRLYWKKKKHKYIKYTLDSPELIFFSIQKFARKQKWYH